MHWVVLTDGNEDLLRQVYAAAKRYKVEIIVVQDFVHVLEYLWKAAYALHPEHAEERESWVMDRATAVLEGRAQDVAVGLRRAATRKQLSQSERKPVDKAADYIDNNQRTTPIRSSPGARTADCHRRHRRGLPSSGQGSDGYHRCALGSGAS